MSLYPTLAECREMALSIAPELAAQPLYVVRHPANRPPMPLIGAYAMQGFVDYEIRDELIAAGQWQGRGATIAFVQEPNYPIMVHELAHVLPVTPPMPDNDPSPVARETQSQTVQAWADAIPSADLPLWTFAHGASFVRRAIHLMHRAHAAGYYVPPVACNVAGEEYDLSHVWDYIRAIGNEIFDLEGATFAEIDATPAPKAFSDLFTADVQAWLDKQSAPIFTIHTLLRAA